jgi:hypothetical protein
VPLFLATRALQQLADDKQHRFLSAAEVTKRDLYVDVVHTGSDVLSDRH